MRHLLLPFLLFLCLFPASYAQSLRILETNVLPDSVVIRYELIDSVAGRSYQVGLYAITGTDTTALDQVEGAVGDSIQPGIYRLRWAAYREWDRYRGTVRFQVRALPNFSFLGPENGSTVRRAKGIEFTWYGQNSTLDSLKIDLFRYEEFIQTIDRVKGRGDYAWRIPPKLPLGEGYRIRLTGQQPRRSYGFSPYFTVDNRYPLWMKVAPPVAAATGYVLFLVFRILPSPEDMD